MPYAHEHSARQLDPRQFFGFRCFGAGVELASGMPSAFTPITGENWQPVVDHADYEVSDLGRVRSWINSARRRRAAPVILKLTRQRQQSGYAYIHLGGGPRLLVHVMVLEAFVGAKPPELEARHLDDDPSNNRASNLVWGTRRENHLDAVRNGRFRPLPAAAGEAHPRAKLTEEEVVLLRKLRGAGWKLAILAARFQISVGHAWHVANRDAWSAVE